MLVDRETLKVSLRNFTIGELTEELSKRLPEKHLMFEPARVHDGMEEAKQKYLEVFMCLADSDGVKDGSAPHILNQLNTMMANILEF